jgi:hypothetical protein
MEVVIRQAVDILDFEYSAAPSLVAQLNWYASPAAKLNCTKACAVTAPRSFAQDFEWSRTAS